MFSNADAPNVAPLSKDDACLWIRICENGAKRVKLITLNPPSVALVLLFSGIPTREEQRTGFVVGQSQTPHLRPRSLLCFRKRRKPSSSCPSCREPADRRPWSSTSSAAPASSSTCQKKPASSRSSSPVGDTILPSPSSSSPPPPISGDVTHATFPSRYTARLARGQPCASFPGESFLPQTHRCVGTRCTSMAGLGKGCSTS